MSNDLLYFPKMSIKRSKWLNAAILLSDKCKIIVPHGHCDDDLNNDTLRLIDARFIERVSPEGIVNFHEEGQRLLDYLKSIPISTEKEYFHFGKINDDYFIRELIFLRIVEKSAFNSYLSVSRPHALALMSYIAMVMGDSPYVNATPFTDMANSLNAITVGSRRPGRESYFNVARGLIPVPEDADPIGLLEFKRENLQLYREFKAATHAYMLMTDERRREEDRRIFDVGFRIRAGYRQRGWRKLRSFDLLCMTAASVAPFIEHSYYSAGAAMLPIIAKLKKLYDENGEYNTALRSPWAYGALAQQHVENI